MLIRFWGARGSLAKPGPTTLRYGGNTSCVEVRTADGTLIVLDCGTGAHELGQSLEAGGLPQRGHLLITHTHWDHIQGFPFFAPLFGPRNEWDIYAPGGLGQELERTLAGQMEYTYFPVTLKQLGATIRYHDLVEGSFALAERLPPAHRKRWRDERVSDRDGTTTRDALDRRVLDQLREDLGDIAALREIISTFLERSPSTLTELREAAARGNVAAVSAGAHAMKGTSATLGALTLSAQCAELERLARAGSLAEVVGQVSAIEAEYGSVDHELRLEAGRE